MINRQHYILLLAIFLSFPGMSYGAYKWVDEEGNVHYTQTKPEDVTEAEKIKPPPGPETEKALLDLREDQSRSTTLENEREKKRIEEINRKNLAENKKKNCESTTEILKQLQNYERVKTVDADGTVRWASDEEKQSQIEEAKANVRKWCD